MFTFHHLSITFSVLVAESAIHTLKLDLQEVLHVRDSVTVFNCISLIAASLFTVQLYHSFIVSGFIISFSVLYIFVCMCKVR